jgi:hypothetical protein
MKTPVTQPPAAGEAAHTPTPYCEHTAFDCRYTPAMQEIVIIGQGVGIAKILKSGRSGLDEANAAFIIRACNSHAALLEYKQAAELFEEFMATLPRGWLGKTCGDIGLLNQAYLTMRKAKHDFDSSS